MSEVDSAIADETPEAEKMVAQDIPELVLRKKPLMFSVFTPTHNPQYLEDAYRSLQQQNVNWEWIISPNGAATQAIPVDIVEDPRVRIIPAPPQDLPKIGMLKRFCCDQAHGDVFVELDHDDMLVPGILEKVQEKVHEGAGFVYSDAAVFLPDPKIPGESLAQNYSPDYGWESYTVQVYEQTYLATRAFPPDARTLCEIFYAPDHVRCWTREAYYKAGGHDVLLEVGDDHDLLCRTYLAKVPFMHTGTCGYLYRMHPSNTVTTNNAAIQNQNKENRQNYLWRLIDAWIIRTGLRYLDLTTAKDNQLLSKTSQGWHLAVHDNSVGCVKIYDYLHRFPMSECIEILNEIYRVLAPGGWLCMAVPDTSGCSGFLPYARSYWNALTIDHLIQRKYADIMNGELAPTRYNGRFQLVQILLRGSQDANADIKGGKTLIVDMMAIKEQFPGQPPYRVPGKVYI